MKNLLIILLATTALWACEKEEVKPDVFSEVFVQCLECEIRLSSDSIPEKQVFVGHDEPIRLMWGQNIKWYNILAYTIDTTPVNLYIYEDSVLVYEQTADTVRYTYKR